MREINKLTKQLKEGTLSRRQFSKLVAGMGLGATLATSTINSAFAQTPKKGGELRMVFHNASQLETFDPIKRFNRLMAHRDRAVYNCLTDLTPDLNIVPGLAESWEANDSATEWVFKLRKGVSYHNGRALHAKDVVYSINRIYNKEEARGGTVFVEHVTDIIAEDQHTVRFKLNTPDVDLPSVLALLWFAIIPEGNTDEGIGTGPFKLEEFEPAVSATLIKNENYWKSGYPHVDAVTSFAIPDPIARLNACIAGEADIVNQMTPTLIDKINTTDGVELVSVPSGYRTAGVMRVDVAPFNEPEVREAMKLLIDRETYNKIVYKGQSIVGNDHPVAPIYPEHCAEITQRDYDPEKAIALLKKHGLEKAAFELFASEVGIGAIEGAQVWTQMAAKAGVNFKTTKVPSDGFWDAIWRVKPFIMSQWNMRPTANSQLAIAFRSGASWNDTFWGDDRFDQLLTETKGEKNAGLRKEMYCEMQQILHDDGGQVIMSFVNILNAASSRVKNIVGNPVSALEWVAESAWLDA